MGGGDFGFDGTGEGLGGVWVGCRLLGRGGVGSRLRRWIGGGYRGDEVVMLGDEMLGKVHGVAEGLLFVGIGAVRAVLGIRRGKTGEGGVCYGEGSRYGGVERGRRQRVVGR